VFNSQTQSPAMIESLEGRQLLSAAPAPAVAGTYKGDANYGASRAIKFVIKAKSEMLTVKGIGSGSQKLTAAQLTALEGGAFAYTGSIDGEKLVFTGTVSGSVISGTFTGKGKLKLSGTFSVTKT
jgi:hypothetical protein